MKKYYTISLCMALCITFASCSSQSYEDGFAAGFEAGFRAGIESVSVQVTSPVDTKETETTIIDTPENSLVELAEPVNGHFFQKIPDCDYLAPLSIETVGTSGYYFILDPISLSSPSGSVSSEYAKIIAMNSYIRLYIRGGSSIDIEVPLGEYEIFYATGDSWFGEDDLFGPGTQYYKCDDTFLFQETSDGYNGWTISLAPVTNGNLDTDLIDSDSFPK